MILFIILSIIYCSQAAPTVPLIQSLRARYDHPSDAIFVQWTFADTTPGMYLYYS